MSRIEGGSFFVEHRPKETIGKGDLIALNRGYLPFSIPSVVRQATAEATINPGLAEQTDGRGVPELRNAIARRFYEQYGIGFDQDNVLVTNGSSRALSIVFSRANGLYEESNSQRPPPKLWTPEIGYNYATIACASGIGDVARYPLKNGVPDVDQIEDLLRKQHRANVFVYNSPANPTGKLIPDDVLSDLASLYGEFDLAIEDNVFAGITYDGRVHATMARHLWGQTSVIGSTSKEAANWNIGWVMAPDEYYNDYLDIREATGGVFSPAQTGAAVLFGEQCKEFMNWVPQEMQRKRDLMQAEVIQIPGYEDVEPPEGGFFYFLEGLPPAQELKEECRVVISEGDKYGLPSHRRISFSASDEAIRKGMGRIREYMAA